MNGIDIFIYVIFAAAAILGYARGFVRQAGSIAAVVVGILAARMFGPWATEHLFAGATEPEGSSMTVYGARTASYAVVFVVTWIVVWLVSRLLHGAIKAIKLGGLNSIGGTLFTMLEWALGISLMLNIWHLVSPSWTAPTALSQYVMKMLPWLTGALGAS